MNPLSALNPRLGLAALLLLAILLQAADAAADRRGDDDSFPEERLSRVAPPEKVLQRVLERFPGGRVLKMELEDEEGLVYEVKILTPDGRVVEWVLKAEDLTVIRERGKEKERRHHP